MSYPSFVVRSLCSVLFLCGAVACSADSGKSQGGQSAGIGGFSGASGAAAGTTGAAGAAGSFGNPVAGISGGAAGVGVTMIPDNDGGMSCAGVTTQAKSTPVDLYIMMDQSISMELPAGDGTRWSVVSMAMQMFLNSPQAAGLGVGIQYFGLGISCTASDYAKPEVEIGELPGNTAMLLSSLGMHGPIAVTPTTPALDGAIMHAQAWQTAHPDHAVAVILATDGEPDACGATTDTVAMSAATGLAGMPSIHTYVIGVGSGLMALNQVAASGGTDQALIVDTGTDATQQFFDALDKIRKQATLPCQYAIPAANGGGAVDFDKVNVTFGATGGATQTILRAPDISKCDPTSGGWYYDNPTTPKSIQLCDASCKTIGQGGDSSLNIVLGCQSQAVPQ